MIADDGAEILVYKNFLDNEFSQIASAVSKISTGVAIRRLLLDPSGNVILVMGPKSAHLRGLDGTQKGSSITIPEANGSRNVSLHPTRAQDFVLFGTNDFTVHSWETGVNEDLPIHDILGDMSLDTIFPCTLNPSAPENSKKPSTASAVVLSRPMKYTAHLFPAQSRTDNLHVWPAESISGSTSCYTQHSRRDPDHLGSRIRQIIAIWDAKLLFLDKNLWVCSLDLSPQTLSAKAVKRHFFLLSEWECGIGREPFIMVFSEPKREFLIAFRECLLVVKGGLDLAEPWDS